MKSGIVTRSDPYLMDPSLLVVDPNLILDCSSSFKDEAHCSYNDSLLDLINCDDSQLESIILGGNGNGLCGSFDMNPMTPENDFDEFLKGLEIGVNNKEQQALTAEAIFAAGTSSIDLTPPLTPVHQPFDQLSACIFDSGIANFEEVAFSSALDDAALSVKSEPPNSPSGLETDDSTTSVAAASTATDLDFTDNESVHSFTTESSSATLKRKLQEEDAEDDDDDDFSIASPKAPKRRKPARRNRRVQDERVKNQNKIAALKYRMKKRSEKNVLDIELEVEEEKNKKLKAQVEELTVNVKVLKELLASQLKQ